MKQDDKQLLIKDLCARLPYGVKVKSLIDGKPVTLTGFDSTPIPHFYDENDAEWDIEDINPYLLPISSMTEEQRKEYNNSTCGKYWHYTPTIETYN